MDTDSLVNERLEDGETLIKELIKRRFDLTAAFWIQNSWDERWRFYIVSPTVDSEGSLKAYIELQEAMRHLEELATISLLSVRVIGPTHPLGRDVLAALHQMPTPRTRPFRWGGIWLGNDAIDNAYFYPLPTIDAAS